MNTTSNVEVLIGDYKLLSSGFLPNTKDEPININIGPLKYTIFLIKDSEKTNIERIQDKEDNKKMTIKFYYNNYSSNFTGTSDYLNVGTLGGKKIFLSLYFLGGFEKGNQLINYNVFEDVDHNG